MKIFSGDGNVSMEIVNSNIIINSRGANVAVFRGMQGEQSIAIRSITSVEVKPGGSFFPGYIHLAYPGARQFRGGLAAAASDPNTLIFHPKSNVEVQEFAAEINRRRAGPQQVAKAAHSTAVELEKLVELHKSGSLSDEEFAAAKRKALGA